MKALPGTSPDIESLYQSAGSNSVTRALLRHPTQALGVLISHVLNRLSKSEPKTSVLGKKYARWSSTKKNMACETDTEGTVPCPWLGYTPGMLDGSGSFSLHKDVSHMQNSNSWTLPK
ncbi:hypothetical protein RvY_00060 [Ramazzottius varieornatus]|uniref:Uncharacterized protein n=1 Tax=Ramazzottius varieornatus TaxID=947166 RepID=A0A1D1ULY8_RAMVA|nr:hypothetical protein RvY_00060 [Ramazzottius varieornatus]